MSKKTQKKTTPAKVKKTNLTSPDSTVGDSDPIYQDGLGDKLDGVATKKASDTATPDAARLELEEFIKSNGRTLSDAEKDKVLALWELGKTVEAQRVILEIVEERATEVRIKFSPDEIKVLQVAMKATGISSAEEFVHAALMDASKRLAKTPFALPECKLKKYSILG